MKKNEKYMVKPLNEKEQRNVSGGYTDPHGLSEILGTGDPVPPKKQNPIEDLTKFY